MRGNQDARIFWAPPYASTSGPEVIDLAKMAGLVLDEWQQKHLTAALGETAAHLWAALEVGLVVARQNGKNGELEARQLGGLFLIEEPLQIHSAHMADTSVEQFLRLENLIEGTPELSRRVQKVSRGKGNEEILLRRHPRTGVAPRLRFRPRTGSGGRGFSCNGLYLDEAMILPQAFHGTLMPTLSAQPNPQVWLTGSAPDEDDPAHDGVVLARIRERALRQDPSVVYAEHSTDVEHPNKLTEEMALEPARWAEANPALGIRITADYIEKEQRSMSQRAFAIERLGVGAWPRTDGLEDVVITPEMWAACVDRDSKRAGHVCFSVDTSPDRKHTSIAVAGDREDGLAHVELVDYRHGTGWVVDRIVELVKAKPTTAVVIDSMSPAASLVSEITDALRRQQLLAGLNEQEITLAGAKEQAQACGMFYDAVDQQTMRHIGQPEMDEACRSAIKRPLTDAWAWSRTKSGGDISPLVAGTLAAWANASFRKREAQFFI